MKRIGFSVLAALVSALAGTFAAARPAVAYESMRTTLVPADERAAAGERYDH